MGQFGNLISCAKEEICLNSDCSPELIFPNTLISPMADFLHQKEFCSGWKWTLKPHWKLSCAEEDFISWENCSRSCSFYQTPGSALLQGDM